MGNYLKQIIVRLKELNDLASNGAQQPSMEQAMRFYRFFNDFQDTNSLIEDAEALAHENLDVLEEEIKSLLSLIDKFKTFTLAIDYKEVCEQQLQPYEERYETAKGLSTQLWQDYQSMSNRLDYLPLDSDEYKELYQQCDAAKAAYDIAHADTERLYNEYDAKRREYADLYFFKIDYVDVLTEKVKGIAESIMLDISNLRKEGSL